MSDIESFLTQLRLQQHIPAFKHHEIDVSMINSLTTSNFKDLAVTLVGHRLLICWAAKQITSSPVSSSTSSSPLVVSSSVPVSPLMMVNSLSSPQQSFHQADSHLRKTRREVSSSSSSSSFMEKLLEASVELVEKRELTVGPKDNRHKVEGFLVKDALRLVQQVTPQARTDKTLRLYFSK